MRRLAIGFIPLTDAAVLIAAAELGGSDQHGGVGERDEADGEASHLNRSAAVMTDWAMSTMRFFSFIAVRRSSA